MALIYRKFKKHVESGIFGNSYSKKHKYYHTSQAQTVSRNSNQIIMSNQMPRQFSSKLKEKVKYTTALY